MIDSHYESLFERATHERDWYKGLLFDAWNTMRGQTKGLQRQHRKIKRLQEQIKILKAHPWIAVNTSSDAGEQHG
jgi:hypothetical protein